MAESTASLLPLEPAPFAVHLVLADGAAPAAQPFVRIGEESDTARCYRALLVSETGLAIEHLVLKLPVETPAQAVFPDEEAPATNLTLEEAWEAARRDLARLQRSPRYFPALVLPARDGEATLSPVLPPLLYCSLPRRFFALPCPACLAPLRTCRDDAALTAAGLPPFATTTVRFLACPACRQTGAAPRFFVSSFEVGERLAARGVVGLAELRHELAATLAQEVRPVAAQALPCAGCPEATACLAASGPGAPPAGAKRARPGPPSPAWTVFIPHDSPYLITRLASLPFDALADRLGRRPQEPASAADGPPAPSHLFAGEGSGIDAVEVLALKLAAFAQLLRAVREYYRQLGLPHLDIYPGHIVVEPASPSDYLPEAWGFQVKLLGTSAARLCRLTSHTSVLLPPRAPRGPFQSPAVRELYLTPPRPAELVIGRVLPEPGEQARWRLSGRLADPHGVHPRPRSHDQILLVWPDDLAGLGVPSAVAHAEAPAGGPAERDLLVTTEPLPLERAAVGRIEAAGGLRVSGLRYKIYPSFGTAEDCYSLGAILLRLLLVNDRQTLRAVIEATSACLEQAAHAAGAGGAAMDAALAGALAGQPALFAKSNLFYGEADRAPGRPNSVPDDLWTAALGIAFTLLLKGGDTARVPRETEPRTSEIDETLAVVEALLHRLHAVLFHRQAVNLEIQSVIAELLGDDARTR